MVVEIMVWGGWVGWGKTISGVYSIWIGAIGMCIAITSISISEMTQSSVSVVSVVEISWISFGLGLTLGNSMGVDKGMSKSTWNCSTKMVDAWGTSDIGSNSWSSYDSWSSVHEWGCSYDSWSMVYDILYDWCRLNFNCSRLNLYGLYSMAKSIGVGGVGISISAIW